MARSLEELELAFQAEYPKVDKKSKRAFGSKAKKAATKETTKDITKAKEETYSATKEGKEKEAEGSAEDTISFSILDIIFYLVLIVMIAGAVIFSNEVLRNQTIGGRRFYEVTATSMQSVYPKGSLVFTEKVEPDQLAVGDDIVFLNEANDFITSRITTIEENHQGTDEKAFITVGVDDEADSSEVALASLIRGKVTGSIPLLGTIFGWIGGNLWLVFVILGVILLLTLCIKIFGRKDKNAKKSAVDRKGKVADEDE